MRVLILAVTLAVLAIPGHAPAADQPPDQSPAKVKALEAQIKAQFARFVKKPTGEGYLQVQKLLVSHPKYEPYSDDLDDVGNLVRKGQFPQAQAKLAAAWATPNLLLSPRAHHYAALIARATGNQRLAKREADMELKCLKGILGTGDGTDEKPYLVTRISDEYDVTRHLKQRVSVQGLKHKDGRSFDVLECTGGTVLWFDVTLPFKSMSKRFKQKESDGQ